MSAKLLATAASSSAAALDGAGGKARQPARRILPVNSTVRIFEIIDSTMRKGSIQPLSM
jgi:hypothetical protein